MEGAGAFFLEYLVAYAGDFVLLRLWFPSEVLIGDTFNYFLLNPSTQFRRKNE